MFVLTAKFSKKKLVAAILALVVIAAAITIAVTAKPRGKSAAADASVRDNAGRVAYLESFGWKVSEEPLETQSVVIPKSLGGVFAKYNELQTSQGFDLKDYGGLEAVRYTYAVKNHPTGDGSVVADIIVYRNKVIAGDVQSTALNGFMSGLAFPKS